MDDRYKPLVDKMQSVYHAELKVFRDEVTLLVRPEQIVEVMELLKKEYDYRLLVNLTAVDYWPQESPRFHMIYHLRNMQLCTIVSIRAPLDGNAPIINTIERVYPNANWFEREVWDLFGIRFEGHSDMRRIVLPYEWVGHPLRKDYPLGYEEVQFTFNYDEIDLRKPYAKE